MDSQKPAAVNLAQQWQMHCQQQPQRFLPVRGTSATRQRIEEWERAQIQQMSRKDLPLEVRAIALRSIIELRACTARDVASFFAVDPRVIVAGLSLLEISGDAVLAAAANLPAKPRTKAA